MMTTHRLLTGRGAMPAVMAAFPVLFTTMAMAGPGPAFSALDTLQRGRLRELAAPPPAHERYGPYSTPMYYLMHKGYPYDGDLDKDPAKRTYIKDKPGPHHGSWRLKMNHPEWQEAMIRDWAELGLNNTHLNVYPIDEQLSIQPEVRRALVDFMRLSDKHGLKIGIRLDALGAYAAWEMHPNNPDNRIEEYLGYVREVATLFKGKTLYYVMGDEMRLHEPEPGLDPKLWTPDIYLAYFKKLASTIRTVDPDTKVSMFAASSGEWFNVLYLLKHGYSEYGDAVAINHYDYTTFPKFYAEAQKLAPGLLFLSNGVGYHSTATAAPRFPEGDPYSRIPTEQGQGEAVAKTMFVCWDLNLSTAPYYITLRNWVLHGRVYPRWFGFFGFTDFVIDEYNNMTVRRYPAWYACRTVTHTFYNRDRFSEPAVAVTASPEPGLFRAYEHELADGARELLVMTWSDKGPMSTTLSIADAEYRYAVRVDTFNYHRWIDLPYDVADGKVTLNLEVTQAPTIIRLIRLDANVNAE